MSETQPKNPSRRGLLRGALGGAIGFGLGAGMNPAISVITGAGGQHSSPATESAERVPAAGQYQAGIHLPAVPQLFGRVAVIDTELAKAEWLATLGSRILELAAGEKSEQLLPDGPGDLTISVGLGPRLIAAINPAWPGAEELPPFAGDESIEALHLGGDVMIAAHSSDPTVLGAVLAELMGLLPGAQRRWEQPLFRGPGVGSKARNPLGFMDGIVVPHGDTELEQSVWIGSGALAGATVCVIRRLRIDAERFRALTVDRREEIIGRRLSDGAPLSGGGPDDQIDLTAKTPEGDYLVPARAHARGAHPSFTGSALMLRRSYSFENNGDVPEAGLLFVSFQNELGIFTATQQRLDEVDDLMGFTTTTASGTFLMLPGFSRQSPLGSALFA
ncbi:MAG: Dyp-type peroxidase [Rhodoglobus sp.]